MNIFSTKIIYDQETDTYTRDGKKYKLFSSIGNTNSNFDTSKKYIKSRPQYNPEFLGKFLVDEEGSYIFDEKTQPEYFDYFVSGNGYATNKKIHHHDMGDFYSVSIYEETDYPQNEEKGGKRRKTNRRKNKKSKNNSTKKNKKSCKNRRK
jgi:hypothetical protein